MRICTTNKRFAGAPRGNGKAVPTAWKAPGIGPEWRFTAKKARVWLLVLVIWGVAISSLASRSPAPARFASTRGAPHSRSASVAVDSFHGRPVESRALFSSKEWEPGLAYYGYRFYNPEMGRWINRDPIEEFGGINLMCYAENSPLNIVDSMGLLTDSATASFWAAMASGNYKLAEGILWGITDAIGKTTATEAMAAALAAAILGQGLIDQMNSHIDKVTSTCPSLSPDPNDPKEDPVKGWIDEIKASVRNLKQYLKKAPNNAAKREPIEAAIKKGEDFLKKAENASGKPCNNCTKK